MLLVGKNRFVVYSLKHNYLTSFLLREEAQVYIVELPLSPYTTFTQTSLSDMKKGKIFPTF